MQAIDFMLLNFIHDHFQMKLLDDTMPFITSLGNYGSVWIALAAGLLMTKKHRKVGLALIYALILELIISNAILKPTVARIRPCDINTAVDLLITLPHDFSFPSGHAGASFAAFFAIWFSRPRPKLWVPVLVLASLIAFSRLYLYVHFPSDVLAGVVIGALCGLTGCKLGNYKFR